MIARARAAPAAGSVDSAPSMRFDPFDPHTNQQLMGKAERLARRLGLPADFGPGACQDLLVRVLEGDARLLCSQGLFVCALTHRLQDLRRRNLRQSSLESCLSTDGPAGSRDDRVMALRLATEAHPEKAFLAEEEKAIARAARVLLARAVRELSPARRTAFVARLRGRLARSRREAEIADAERALGISLGPYDGTAKLARTLGLSPGTVASDAHRAEKEIVAAVRAQMQRWGSL